MSTASADPPQSTQVSGLREARRVPQAGEKLPLPALIFAFCIVLPIGFNVGPAAFTTLRLFLLIMTGPLLLRLFMGHFGRIRMTDIFFILHFLWMIPAFIVNNPASTVNQVGSAGVEFLGGYLIGRAYIRRPEHIAGIAKFFTVSILCLLPFVLMETQTGRPFVLNLMDRVPGIWVPRDVNNPPRLYMERAQGTFTHPIHWGLFCSIVFSLCFVGLKGRIGTFRRWLGGSIVAFSGFLALSSGALLAIALQYGLIIWDWLFRRNRRRWWILVGLFAGAYVTIDLLSNRSPMRVFMSYATFSAGNAYYRALIFEFGLQSVWAKPIFGQGLNDWDWARPDYMHSPTVDNFWLAIAMRYGIPGFLTLTLGYLLAIYKVLRRNFSDAPEIAQVRKAWMFTCIGLTFTLATVHVWSNIYSLVFFTVGAGMWMIEARNEGGGPKDAGEDGPGPAPGRGGRRFTRFPPGGTGG